MTTRTRPLHIGVDGRELVGQPTGVGRYLSNVLRVWAADPEWPHRLTVFVPSTPSPELTANHPRVTWVVEQGRGGGTWWEQVHLSRAIRRAGVDVFFAVGYTAPVRIVCPFVVVIHDVSFFAHPEWFRPREGLRRRWLTRHAAHHAHEILTVSNFSADEIVRWLGVDRARIRLAPPGTPAKTPSSGHGGPEPLVLYVGSLFNRRNIPELVRSFALVAARLPAARLMLVGDNRTSPPVDPVALAVELGLESRVEWRAYASDAELDRVYARARVFAFLSDYEGFAMTPFEAIAHGVPPVMLDTRVAREIQGAGALLVPLDRNAIAAAIARLLTDDRAHADLVRAGDERLAHFSWDRTAATVRDALERAVSAS